MYSFRLLLWWLCVGISGVQAAVLLPTTAAWHWRLVDEEPASSNPGGWREEEYEGLGAGWSLSPGPLQRGLPGGGTALPQQVGGLLVRTTVVIPNPEQYSTYRFNGSIAGGVVMWLNGVEIWRDGVDPGVNDVMGRPQPGTSTPRSLGAVLTRAELPGLRAGTNVLSAMILPEGASQPLRWLAWLEADQDVEAPLIVRMLPEPGAVVPELTEIEVLFNEPVRGVDAGDLLVNGIPAVAVTPLAPDQYQFTVPAVDRSDVRIEWKIDAAITDRATPANIFLGDAWSYTVQDVVPPDGVVISEFMADNDRTLRDEDGDDVDWIELHNPATRDVRLLGWGLSDASGSPFKWRFPDVVLPARGFLLVYASEKNRTNVPGRLHTNFKLDAGGEYLGLVNAAGEVVSAFAPRYPAQSVDVSYGRAGGAPQITGYFDKPTPGAVNSASGSGYAPGVEFSRAAGTYSGSIAVSLRMTAVDTNAVIRFTTNNTLPSVTSPVYQGPLTFTTAVVLRARTFSPGRLPGPPNSAAYTPLSVPAAQVKSDLPILLLHNFGRGRPSITGVPGTVQVFEPIDGVSSMTNAPTLSARALLASRGSSTEGLAKVSLKVEFRDEFELDRDVSWLGMPEESDWVLYAPNVYDPIMTHNPFMYGLARDLGYYASRTRFVEVYLVQTGVGAVQTATYNGIYVLEEKVKRGKDRVDVDKLEPEHALEPEVTGGYLFKVDRSDPGDTGFSAAGTTMMYVDPKEPEIERADRAAQRAYVSRFFSQFSAALNGANYRDPTNGYAKFFDVDPSIDFHILNSVAFNVDALVLSTYLHKPRGGKLTFGPVWDFDRSLGSTDGRDVNPRTWGANLFTFSWWPRLFSDPDFMQRWIDRYQAMRLGPLSLSNSFARLDGLTAQLKQAQPRERAKWGTSYRGGTYATEIVYSKNWLSNRLDFIDTRFVPMARAGEPVIEGGGTQIRPALEQPAAANLLVYYTTDGTDPRLPGGGISGAAKVYSALGPPVFTRNTRVIARNYSTVTRTGIPNSRWGGPLTNILVLQRPALRITEVHYHPAVEGDAEFVEVWNTGTNTVLLNGWQLAGGIQFRFSGTNTLDRLAAGERCIVVADRATYGPVPAGVLIAGEYQGRLANGGDRIELRGPVGELVDAVEYDDLAQPLADGGGWSLVPKDESALETMTWRLSFEPGGSPGRSDRASLPGPGGDLDRDGLPDVWESLVGLAVGNVPTDTGGADRDGDGVSNLGEFLAGTDPLSAASVMTLRAVVGTDGQLQLGWTRVPGRAVRVMVKDDLWAAERVLVDVPARGSAGDESVTDTLGGGARYYRLSVP